MEPEKFVIYSLDLKLVCVCENYLAIYEKH